MGTRRAFKWSLSIISMAALLAATAPAPTAAAGSCPDFKSKASEVTLGELINAFRLTAGKGRLQLDPELSMVARKHTGRMARKKKLVHTPLPRLGQLVTRWRALGENIARGKNVGSVYEGFKRSSFHRENLLGSPYRHFGIGIKVTPTRIWATVVFSGKKDPGTSLTC